MIPIMSQLIAKVETLSEEQQAELASQFLELLEEDAKWQALFDKSEDFLTKMAEKALADRKAGKTRPLNLDEL